MTLEEFNNKYVYMTDKDKYGITEVWEIPKPSADGFIYADCESYCRYLRNNIEGFSDWDYYYCELGGNGHCILIKGSEVIDCNIKKVVLLDEYCKLYNVRIFKKYSKFVIVSKIIVSWGFLLWKKLLG